MFSSKKREAKQNAAEEAQKTILQAFDQGFADVKKLQDPAEKLLKLEQIKNAIDAVRVRINGEIRSQSNKKWFAPYLPICGGSAGTLGLVAFAHIAAPPITLLTLPAILVGDYVESSRVVKEKTRLTQASSEFLRALETQKTKAATLSETLLDTALPAIARSGKFKDLLAVLPSVRDQCAAAFSKQASTGEQAVLVEQKKPSANALSL
jgi:hypothetical protein